MKKTQFPLFVRHVWCLFFILSLFPKKHFAQDSVQAVLPIKILHMPEKKHTVEMGIGAESNDFFSANQKPMYRQFFRHLWNVEPEVSLGPAVEQPYANNALYPSEMQVEGTSIAFDFLLRIKMLKLFFQKETWLDKFSESGVQAFIGTALRTESPGTLPWLHYGLSAHFEVKVIDEKNYALSAYVESIFSLWDVTSDQKRTVGENKSQGLNFSSGIGYSFSRIPLFKHHKKEIALWQSLFSLQYF